MHHSLRAITVALISASLSLVLGCTGDGGGGDGGSGGSGQTTGNTGGSTGTASFDWSGTWSVQLDYAVDCEYAFDNVKHADLSFSSSVQIATDGKGGAVADIMGYQMEGTASSSKLKLSGQYPVQDENKSVAADLDASNNITLDIGKVVNNQSATGSVSGVFEGQFGATCTITSGTAAFSR